MSIEVKDLSFRYREHQVLKQISFRAEDGELLCILGPNGVGKSTLFRCILGLLDHYEGEILADGESLRRMPPARLAKKIAYIPQSHYPTFNHTVFNTVLMGATPRVGLLSTPKKEEEERAEQALVRLGIQHLKNRGYGQISGGERQLVLIARAMLQQAKTLLMDEPTANLDYGNQVRVMEAVRGLAQEGYAVILSTHNPDHAMIYGDRALTLMEGQVLRIGKPGEILTEDLLQQLYGIPVSVREMDFQGRRIHICIPLPSVEFHNGTQGDCTQNTF